MTGQLSPLPRKQAGAARPRARAAARETNATERVKMAGRTLDLFDAFAQAKTPLTLTEIAGRIHAPVSSCHALIRTLQSLGYLYVLNNGRRCYPTRRLLDIATAVADHDPILEKFAHVLKHLRDVTRETVILGKRSGNQIIYLDVIEGLETIRYAAHAGDRKPLHSSAIGKAMLAAMPPAEFDRFLRTPLRRVNSSTIVDPQALKADIAAGRRRGYFMTRGENVVDVTGLAVIHEVEGEAFGVALAGPIQRFQRNKSRYVAALRDALNAEEIAGPPSSED